MVLRLLEIVEQRPGVEGAHTGAVGNRPGQFGQHLPIPFDPPPVGHAIRLLGRWRVEIAAIAFGDLDRQAIIPGNPRRQIVDAARLSFEAGLSALNRL